MTHFPNGIGGYAARAVVGARLAARLRPDTIMVEPDVSPLAADTACHVLVSRHAAGKGHFKSQHGQLSGDTQLR
jgi:hypothetical protein